MECFRSCLYRCSPFQRCNSKRLKLLEDLSNKELISKGYADKSYFQIVVETTDNDSAYDKALNERRGSAPIVSSLIDENMESSTSSKLSNFWRRGFKSNLKRTKSVTKLDRKRSNSNIPDTETSSLVHSLKRTMSLGRLSRKRKGPKSSDILPHPFPCECVIPTPENIETWSLISSRIRSARSHESLLTNPVMMHSIDLTSSDIEIKPLHRSIVGQEHCFHVTTSSGSKYFSCRTSEELEKWTESFRKTLQPNQDQKKRTNNSLKIWIVEAKNVQSKKRYYCEILLDKDSLAKTATKTKADMLFWGEQFEFNNIRPVETFTVKLWREADKKKKKDKNTIVGYINIPISEVSGRQYVERWFTASSGTVGKAGREVKSELALIRMKVRYQTTDILPMELYHDLIQYLSYNYCVLCELIEPLLGVRDKEDIATVMVHIMQGLEKACNFLSDVVMAEIARLDNQHLTFRGNTIATKAMEAYMKLVGEKYLQDTLREFIRTIVQSDEDCEVDPTRVHTPATLQRQQTNLKTYSDIVWAKIINSYCYFPRELKDVFSCFRKHCEEHKKDDMSDNLISASIFLRFLCPAILSPSLFNLTQEFPPEMAARNLTLIAKTIQTLANFTRFGGGKEEFMTFLNGFVEQETDNMKVFLQRISSTEGSSHCLRYDGYIDVGKELSMLHTLLSECLSKADEKTLYTLSPLPEILTTLTAAHSDPIVGQRPATNRRSQIYDNLVNVPTSTSVQQDPVITQVSPTEVLRDMLRHCGESPDDLFKCSDITKQGCFDVGSSQEAANDLTTNDDYVLYNAISVETETEVGNVSVNSQTVTHENVNKSWNEIVSAAEVVNGEYIDLITFMDEDAQNSSMELEQNANGSQMSISQLSTLASSGYQSFGYSQSSSPVDSNEHGVTRDATKSPSHVQPLSFSNPVYRHHHKSSHSMPSPVQQTSSSSSVSSNDESCTIKYRSPVKNCHLSDPLHKLAPLLSSSSSSESLQDQGKPKCTRSKSVSQAADDCVKFSLDLSTSSPIPHSETSEHFPRSDFTNYYNTIGSVPLRSNELSHSVEFACGRRNNRDQLRRTATDSIIAHHCSPVHIYTDSGVSLSPRGQLSPEDSSLKRLSAQSAVHMGIQSVRRRIQEQEKTKQEYENEVEILKQQLAEAQVRLQNAESRLSDHENSTEQVVEEWQHRLEESEQRMRKQQAEKDDQMKNIIQRLIHVEGELRQEQQETQRLVLQKQKVIESQEYRIKSLDNANAKLMTALNQLKERYSSSQAKNGMIGAALRTKLATGDLADFKTSSC